MKRIIQIIACSIVLFGCRKMKVDDPDFYVETATYDFKVGETVRFQFIGNPENIVFYSGEPGFNYQYRDRITGDGTAQLDFTTHQQNTGETNTLQLLVSTDFSGVYDSTNVVKATWTDITNKATLSTGADKTASGMIDLEDLAAQDKPVYFAFRYLGYKHATLKQPTWFIRTFNVVNLMPDGKASLNANIEKVGWKAFDFKNPSVAWSVPATGVITINGTGSGSVNEDNDDWAISRGFDLKAVVPDAGLSIRSLSTVALEGYEYVYKKPGTYTATFVAFNNSADEQKTAVREVTINVQ